MSDAAEPAEPHGDPWAQACAEDLAAERARRRATGQGDTSREAVESLRGFLGRLAGEANRLGPAAGLAARQATAALDPVLERHRDTVTHLARAGDELAAACRAVLDAGSAAASTAGTGKTAGADAADPAGAAARSNSRESGEPNRPEADGHPSREGATTAPNTSPEPAPADPDDPKSGDKPVNPGNEPGQPDQPGPGV